MTFFGRKMDATKIASNERKFQVMLNSNSQYGRRT